MARIRTIKPEFFRHEGLQDLEAAHPGKCVMLVFAGLWGHCDAKGRFEWRPRQLKLDILPFLNFDMADTLAVLEKSGEVKRYSVGGKEYGEIPSFEKHQRLSGKEAIEGQKHPANNGEALGKQRGSDGEIPESQEGKGREEEKEEEGNGERGEHAASPATALAHKAPKRATQLSATFYPTEAGVVYAQQRKLNLLTELQAFHNWHASKGTTMKDWQAAWRTWCDKAVSFGRAGNAGMNGRRPTRDDERAFTNAALTGRIPAGTTIEQFMTGQHAQASAHPVIAGESQRVA